MGNCTTTIYKLQTRRQILVQIKQKHNICRETGLHVVDLLNILEENVTLLSIYIK